MLLLTYLLVIGYLLSLSQSGTGSKLPHARPDKNDDKYAPRLSPEQSGALERLLTSNSNIFVTGKAGTGKSLLLKAYKGSTRRKFAVVAPTGIAALNVGGQTIHSLFSLNLRRKSGNTRGARHPNEAVLKALDVLIIDETSMVRVDYMDKIDGRLRRLRGNDKPFGGVQLIMFGDLYQLPPIVGDAGMRRYLFEKYGGIFFFQAKVWTEASLETVELTRIFRQSEIGFQRLLNSVRTGEIREAMLEALNQRVFNPPAGNGAITIAATNRTVEAVNRKMLSSLTSKEYVFNAETTGKIRAGDYIPDRELRLKGGARVMMTRNDPSGRWVNGSLGEVARISRNSIVVNIDGRKYPLEKATWEKTSYKVDDKTGSIVEHVVGSYRQYPLRLAWAITIHKSQGQTYESCQIDLKHGVFAHGQAYVALSRCKSMEGLYLLSPVLRSDISVAPEVRKFMADTSRAIT